MAKRAREQSLEVREASQRERQAGELREAVGSSAEASDPPSRKRQNETIRCCAGWRKAWTRRQRNNLEDIAFPVGEKTSTMRCPTQPRREVSHRARRGKGKMHRRANARAAGGWKLGSF